MPEKFLSHPESRPALGVTNKHGRHILPNQSATSMYLKNVMGGACVTSECEEKLMLGFNGENWSKETTR